MRRDGVVVRDRNGGISRNSQSPAAPHGMKDGKAPARRIGPRVAVFDARFTPSTGEGRVGKPREAAAPRDAVEMPRRQPSPPPAGWRSAPVSIPLSVSVLAEASIPAPLALPALPGAGPAGPLATLPSNRLPSVTVKESRPAATRRRRSRSRWSRRSKRIAGGGVGGEAGPGPPTRSSRRPPGARRRGRCRPGDAPPPPFAKLLLKVLSSTTKEVRPLALIAPPSPTPPRKPAAVASPP